MASLGLTEKFIHGLKSFNLTFDDITSSGWKYCGGDNGRHLKYFQLCFGNEPRPTPTGVCVCGHKIKEHCYITNGSQTLVLGNCCIRKFIPKSSRTCDLCGKPHKNRVVNRCFECRYGICDKCDEPCDEYSTKCYKCAK